MATGEDGWSLDSVTPEQFALTLPADGATMVGVNCGAGPAATLETVERMAEATDVPLSAQPNAGGPKEVEGRRLVLSSPEFVASYARRYVAVASVWSGAVVAPRRRISPGSSTPSRGGRRRGRPPREPAPVFGRLAHRSATVYSRKVVVSEVDRHPQVADP